MKLLQSSEIGADVYGRQLMAFYLGKSSVEIIERDDGLIDAAGLGGKNYYFAECGDWAPIERRALSRVKGRVLDVGCGAGRHAIHLQRKGFDVLGIDNSPLALKVCRLRGLKRTRCLSIEKIRLLPPKSFNTILMMGNNFGLFGSLRKARSLLRQMDRLTNADGLVIAQTMDPHMTSNPIHRAYHRRNLRRGRLAGQVRIRVRFQNIVGPWIDYLLVSRKELEALLKGTAWRVAKVIASKGPIYIMILRKRSKGSS